MLSWGVQQGQGLPRRGTKWAPQPPISLESVPVVRHWPPLKGPMGLGAFLRCFWGKLLRKMSVAGGPQAWAAWGGLSLKQAKLEPSRKITCVSPQGKEIVRIHPGERILMEKTWCCHFPALGPTACFPLSQNPEKIATFFFSLDTSWYGVQVCDTVVRYWVPEVGFTDSKVCL